MAYLHFLSPVSLVAERRACTSQASFRLTHSAPISMPHKDPIARSKYYKQWYRRNKKTEVARTHANRKTLRDMIREAKNKPCVDCGVQYDYFIMQFDHVRGKKKFDVGRSYLRFGKQQILDEIAKCDVVCANDHAKRTWERAKRFRTVVLMA